jgi:hypothetical protein
MLYSYHTTVQHCIVDLCDIRPHSMYTFVLIHTIQIRESELQRKLTAATNSAAAATATASALQKQLNKQHTAASATTANTKVSSKLLLLALVQLWASVII